jgi:uncharacterized protein YdeI (YjbR/CyaY-like superfamily)
MTLDNSQTVRFQAVIERIGSGPVRNVIRAPFNPAELWTPGDGSAGAARRLLRIKGTLRRADAPGSEGFPFQNTILSRFQGEHFLVINARMLKGAGLVVGSLAEFVLEPDASGDAAVPPPELARLLKADRSLRKWFEAMTYGTRRYIGDSVREPKSADARKRRAETWAERMMLTMEGEQELPPILKAAFRRQPTALAGWEAMTPIQRRTQLMAIYSCVGPDARAKRTERAVAEAVRVAVKRRKG